MTYTPEPPEPTVAEKIKAALDARPWLSGASVARQIGHSHHVVSVIAARHNIRFMNRMNVEAWIEKELFGG